MKNPFNRFIREYLNFSRSDRNAIVILSILIIIVLVANFFISNIEPKPVGDIAEYERILNSLQQEQSQKEYPRQSLFSFNPNTISESELDSLSIPVFIKQNLQSYRNSGGKFYTSADLRKLYGMNDSIFELIAPFIVLEKKIKVSHSQKVKPKEKYTGYFDPNKAELAELRNFGFNDFQANNLLSYRGKGGVFQQADNLLKIYGIDSVFYDRIKDNVLIKREVKFTEKEEKEEKITLELNSADSTQLIKLNGIGSTYATRILKYRELLGGYYSKKQLMEVYNLPQETFQEIESSVVIDTLLINKIRINFAEYKELLRHPYLNKIHVEAILNHRKKNGAFENVPSIQFVEGVSEELYQKIKPYFSCR